MTVAEIIKAVRYCIDEEAAGFSDLADVSGDDSTYMDNIIKAKTGDALRWCCVNAPVDMLYGSDGSSDTGIIKMYNSETITATTLTSDIGKMTLPTSYIKLSRLRASSWHRAVMQPAEEDSDEYAMMYSDTEKGTDELPRAGICRTSPVEIHFQPYSKGDAFEISYVADISGNITPETTDIALPPKIRTSFIYYIAYLVMTAYENVNKATQCYNVAVQNLGLSVKNDNS